MGIGVVSYRSFQDDLQMFRHCEERFLRRSNLSVGPGIASLNSARNDEAD